MTASGIGMTGYLFKDGVWVSGTYKDLTAHLTKTSGGCRIFVWGGANFI